MRAFIPFGRRVLVRVSGPDELTPGGLHIPSVAQEAKLEGVVVAVGSDIEAIRPGHQVLFGRFSGTVLTVNNEPLRLVHEDELHGRFEES